MFSALFSAIARVFTRQPQAAVGPATAPLARRAAPPRMAPAQPAGATMPVAPATLAPAGLGARRPLVAASGALAGFEFYVGASARQQPQRLADEAASRARTANVLGAMRLCINQKLVALAELPATWLARCEGDGQFLPGMYLVLGADAMFDDSDGLTELIERLRNAGVRVGWHPPLRPDDKLPPGRPDFLPMEAPDHPAADAAAWQQAVEDAAERWPGVHLVLLDLPDVDLMEAVLRPPVALAACAVGMATAPAARVLALPPQAHRLLRLLNRLVRDDDSALLVADIKSDAALSVRLLQYLNSAGASVGRSLESIDQAVMVLGRDALYRWVAQMLVRLSPPRPAADALQALALSRARFLELLGRAAGEPNPGSLYLLGLASMLPLLLQCNIDDALASLQLPPQAVQALRADDGPWLRYLAVMYALERHDMVAAEALSHSFGGLDAVLARSAQAWLPN